MTTAAERQRIYRLRKREGLIALQVDVPDTLSDALVELGRLHPADTECREALRAALEALLKDIGNADVVSVTP